VILRALTALSAPAGERSRLSVFYFHRALARPDPLLPSEPDAATFDRMLGWIGSQFRVLDPLDACERLFAGTLPSRPALVTFDDGYRDNFTVALPILQQHRMQAAFFVSTAFLDGSMMFNDRVIEAVRGCTAQSLPLPGPDGEARRSVPVRDLAERRVAIDLILAAIKHLPPAQRDERVLELERAAGATPARGLMMDPGQVAALHRTGMRVGGHTRTHPILLALDDAAAEREIGGGLDDLAAMTGERPLLFAYPNGKPGSDFDARHVSMVERAGCHYAFTTQPGAASRASRRYELPRFTPWDRQRTKFGLRAWRNLAVGR
jgi:peptidoglycan/xylan/chitin deacetylase (PgdA/CDA1 family)